MSPTKIVIVDQSTCAGIGLCEAAAPEVFQIGDDGLAHADADADPTEHGVDDAISNCPTRSIRIVDAHDEPTAGKEAP
jgi:ferredoxin